MIYFNGQYFTGSDLKISPLVDSYMYGYGVFETLRTYNGQIFKLSEHIDRLFYSAQILEIKNIISKDELIKKTIEVFAKSKLSESRIKIVLTNTELMIWPQELTLRSSDWYKTGINIVTYFTQRSFPEVKSMNCLANVMGQKWARKNNCYEALLIDQNNIVREGCYSNLFWVKNNILYTTKTKILKGITRQIVLKIARDMMKIQEIDSSIDQVKLADEVFITNTTSEILPVCKIDNNVIAEGRVGQKTKLLMELFKKNKYI